MTKLNNNNNRTFSTGLTFYYIVKKATDGGHFLDPLKNQPQLLFTSSLFLLFQPQQVSIHLPQEAPLNWTKGTYSE